jgi:plasmid stabilization system protein ParE
VHDFIARDSSDYAAAMVDRIIDTVERLAQFPRSGRAVPEAPSENVREISVPPYRVLYRPGTEIEVIAVIHGARNLGRIKPWRR